MNKQQNVIGWILFGSGITFLVIGIIISYNVSIKIYIPQTESRLAYFFSEFFSWFIIGMAFIAFAEIIRLLHKIYRSMPPFTTHEEKNISEASDIRQKKQPYKWSFGNVEREKIHELYIGETILNIIPSPLEGYCIVMTKDGEGELMRIVDVGGFGAHEVYNEEIIDEIISWYNQKMNAHEKAQK